MQAQAEQHAQGGAFDRRLTELLKLRTEAPTIEELIERERACGVPCGPYHRDWLLQNVSPERVRKLLAKGREFPTIYNSRQGFSGADGQDMPSSSFTAIANTTTETNLYLISMFAPIPAFTMRPGMLYEVNCGGLISTTATPTAAFTGRVGQSATSTSNNLIGASTAVATGSALASAPFYAQFHCGVRTMGVSASNTVMIGSGYGMVGNVATAAGQLLPFSGSFSTVDPTVAQGLGISFAWGTANASNTISATWVFFRSLN